MAQNMNYPGVYRQEIDDTSYNVIDNSTYIAVMGKATKGPINQKVLVKSETELVGTFGAPIVSGTYPLVSAVDYGIYAGIEALKETNNLWYVRLADGTEKYSNIEIPAVSGSTVSAATGTSLTTLVASSATNGGDTPTNIQSLRNVSPNGVFRVGSIGPGTYGNNYAVTVETAYGNIKSGSFVTVAGTSALSAIDYNSCAWGSYYDTDPSNPNATWRNIIKVSFFKKEDYETFNTDWWKNNITSPVESYFCSTKESAKDASGNSLFIEDVINGVSKYIYVVSKDLQGTLPAYTNFNSTGYGFALSNGVDSLSQVTIGSTAWSDLFGNRDTTPLDIVVVVPRALESATNGTEAGYVNSLVSDRLDFIGIIQGTAVNDKTFTAMNSAQAAYSSITNSSYFAKYVGWNLVYDRYNSCRLWLPNAIYAATIMAHVDRVGNTWDAPAGQDVGGIPSGRQNVEITPSLGGQLYDINLNTIKFVRGVGSVIWGQKTAQLKKTARDRINVRRLLLHIEKNVEQIANAFMFKGNTAKLREKATAQINSFMETVKIGSGVEKYKVVCDNSNNPQSSIDAHILNIGIYVMPVQTIEFILVTTTVTNNGVVFGEG